MMQPLEKPLRRKLEDTVKEARDIAETAARSALEQLGVGEAAPYSHLGDSERELRRKLRAHGRQLGDIRNSKTETQEIERLTEEVAYEHWHRMLFARFLAENNLLMYPDPDDPVAVTLEECEDLATDEGAKNGWELASRFAARMLPQIFRPDSPVFQLELPPEHQQKMERLVAELPEEVFTASDSLGWVYQFWQTKKKDEVNASEVKIGARELPAVTQLFTEPYMVSFLLDNSLGAWWASRRLTESDLRNAQGEEELRQKAALPDVPLRYLRFVRSDDGRWTPAGGTFEGWPQHLREFKTLDPCCGSGHFLVAAFSMLVAMRMELEGLSARESVDEVLGKNLHGLEIDQRCVELAAFALALSAWRYPKAGGYRRLPELNLACSGLSVSVAKEEWKQLALDKHNLRIALDWMYDVFRDAPVLGSLLNPAQTDAAKIVSWDELSETILKGLERQNGDAERREAGVVAHGLAKAATLLSGRYHWVITNVPYLKRGNQCAVLQDFSSSGYDQSKACLSTTFLDRCRHFVKSGGTLAVVCPQTWLFLTSYKHFRKCMLTNHTWNLLTRLGHSAFETISGHVVDVVLLILSIIRDAKKGIFTDVTEVKTASEKAIAIGKGQLMTFDQKLQLSHPESRVVFGHLDGGTLLNKYANSVHGQGSFDDPSYVRSFWEFPILYNGWILQQTSSQCNEIDSGCGNVFCWENGKGRLAAMMKAKEQEGYSSGKWKAGRSAWKRPGVAISGMGQLYINRYQGESFDTNVAVVYPINNKDFLAIWCYCASEEFLKSVRKIDRKPKVTPSTFGKVPFDIQKWRAEAAARYPHGLPSPYSEDPAQWLFHGHPMQSREPLQVATARLVGYRWPAELDSTMQLADEARTWIAKSETLLPFADNDGIVCIPPVRGEPSATDRLLNLLAAAYGELWNNDRLSELLNQVGHAGRSLEAWLRDMFFTHHCTLFHHRPFIWHIWDGLRDGFAALVNYHKLDRKNLETLIYTYLGDWISRQKQEVRDGVDGAEEKLSAAENLKKRLEMILQGEAPYDIFVRWKPIEKQPIGWDPELNDGVRINIRPFLSVPDVGKRGAGVLRDKANINWNKDRGKDVPSAPWYHLGPQYGGKEGDRINDHHLTLAEKRTARELI